MSRLPDLCSEVRGPLSRRGFLVSSTSALALVAVTACSPDSSNNDPDLIGTWKVTQGSWGIVTKGSVVSFDGDHTALFSPQDTYALYQEDGNWKLSVTGLLGSGGTFLVKVIDADHVDLTTGKVVKLSLKRVG